MSLKLVEYARIKFLFYLYPTSFYASLRSPTGFNVLINSFPPFPERK